MMKFLSTLFLALLFTVTGYGASLHDNGLTKDTNSLPRWNFSEVDGYYKFHVTSPSVDGILLFRPLDDQTEKMKTLRGFAEKDFKEITEKSPFSTIIKKEEIELNGKPMMIYYTTMSQNENEPKINTVHYYFYHNNQVGYLFLAGNHYTFEEINEVGKSFHRALKYSEVLSMDLLELVNQETATSHTDSASGFTFPLPQGWKISQSNSSGFLALSTKYPSARIHFSSQPFIGESFHQMPSQNWEKFSYFIQQRGNGSNARMVEVAGRGAAYITDFSNGSMVLLTFWDQEPYSFSLILTGSPQEIKAAKEDYDQLLLHIKKN